MVLYELRYRTGSTAAPLTTRLLPTERAAELYRAFCTSACVWEVIPREFGDDNENAREQAARNHLRARREARKYSG